MRYWLWQRDTAKLVVAERSAISGRWGRGVYCGSFEVQREILRFRVVGAEMCTAVL